MRLRETLLATGITMAALALAACGGLDETGLLGLEDCTNEVDDNGDGQIDCADEQCHGHAYCLGYSEYLCDNDVDDDNDGVTDCDDPDCLQTEACDPTREWACRDDLDNDSDGLTDCADPDCLQSDACGESCTDGVDNNDDGLVDCADPQCHHAPDCLSEDCANGVDDDGDGDVDCADAECLSTPGCTLVELCGDGIDNDGDTQIDCADLDCSDNPWCHETLCADGVDNDQNGQVDCDDSACEGQPGCLTSTTCQPAEMIYCDYLVTGTTLGRLSNLETYACAPSTTFDGGERYYRLGVFPGAEVGLELTEGSTGQNLQLVVVTGDDSGPGCDPFGDCLSADSTGTIEQLISMAPENFMDLYIIVDSAGPGGDFQLYVSCFGLMELNCIDGMDDDGDDLVDCYDPDCQGSSDCPWQAEICGDGVDNDGDGLIDCADPDCHGGAACANAEHMCADGIDNDADGVADCADPDCWTTSTCLGGETSCDNNIDDDGDLATDCWDYDCVGDWLCDYWFDFDSTCYNNADCGLPDHFCVHTGANQLGFCSRSCSTPGGFDAECDTDTPLQGLCLPPSTSTPGTNVNRCVLPCGAAYPYHYCPASWACHHPDPSLTDYGICVP